MTEGRILRLLYGIRVGSNSVIKGVFTYGEKKIRGANDHEIFTIFTSVLEFLEKNCAKRLILIVKKEILA
jgi:hypothetical protein